MKKEKFIGVIDYRDDPEGMLFVDGQLDRNKFLKVNKLKQTKRKLRSKIFHNTSGLQSFVKNTALSRDKVTVIKAKVG